MTDTTAPETATPAEPALRVLRGEPTPEELAALVLVVAAASGGEEPEEGPGGVWAHRGRGLGVSPLRQRNPNPAWAWRTGRR